MFRDRIQEHYEELSPRFRGLADFILENTLDVGFLTATALARRVDVDPATVVRFSQEIGYSGYRELSREIKDYINNKLALRYKKGAPHATGLAGELAVLADELSDRVLSFKADVDQIAAVATKIHDADRIFVIGKGESYGVAALWATYLRLIGIAAQAIQTDVTKGALMLRDALENDLVFAISLGLDPDVETGYLVSAARDKGLLTISITTSPTLIPARKAEINLTPPSKTPSGFPSFDTLIGLLSLIWQGLLTLDEDACKLSIESTIQAIDVLIEEHSTVPDYDINAVKRLWEQG